MIGLEKTTAMRRERDRKRRGCGKRKLRMYNHTEEDQTFETRYPTRKGVRGRGGGEGGGGGRWEHTKKKEKLKQEVKKKIYIYVRKDSSLAERARLNTTN